MMIGMMWCERWDQITQLVCIQKMRMITQDEELRNTNVADEIQQKYVIAPAGLLEVVGQGS